MWKWFSLPVSCSGPFLFSHYICQATRPALSSWCLVCGTPIFWQQYKNTVLYLCLYVWLTAYSDYNLMLVLRMEVRVLSLSCWNQLKTQVVINALFCEIFLHLQLTSDGLGYGLYLAFLVFCKWYSVISKWGIHGGCVCLWASLTTCGIWYVPVHKSHPCFHAFIPPQLRIHCSAHCFEACLSMSWIQTKSSLTIAC